MADGTNNLLISASELSNVRHMSDVDGQVDSIAAFMLSATSELLVADIIAGAAPLLAEGLRRHHN